MASGGQPDWGPEAGPADLLHGVPAGIDHLVRGLLGYLDPSTYLGISLGNTVLRTYADGSLPGSDIVESLEDLGVGSLLGAVGIGDLLPESVTPSFAPPDVGSTRIGSGETVQLTQQQIDSTGPTCAGVEG